MFIKDPTKIDLGTIDLSLQLGDKMLAKVPTLQIEQDAKDAWVHELTASNERLREMRPRYEDGTTTARHPRDMVIMLMHIDLSQKLLQLLPPENPIA